MNEEKLYCAAWRPQGKAFIVERLRAPSPSFPRGEDGEGGCDRLGAEGGKKEEQEKEAYLSSYFRS